VVARAGVRGGDKYREIAYRNFFGGDRTLLYLDCGKGYMAVFVQTHKSEKRAKFTACSYN
jgi:hypothetical protein